MTLIEHMAESIDWLDDGTPYSPRFGDRYHSEQGGLAQAREVFLQGCGLPAAWAGLPQWRILETGFGFGLNFLVTWAAWRADPQRPTLLHFVSLEAWPVAAADLLRVASAHPELAPLAQELHAHYWGLLPGIHRLALDGGHVLLTLCIGDAQTLLRSQDWTIDSVYLDGFSPQRNPEMWSLHTLKAVARCCRRGTRLASWSIARAVRDGLAQCGFTVVKAPGVPPKRDNLHATFDPRWEPRAPRKAHRPPEAAAPSRCIVIGGGLAGAGVASSLARRGWQVQVLDKAAAPAAGASGLPVGLCCPHISPDDSVLSRLSRSGVRFTLQQAEALLQSGTDWQMSGVLEHRVDGSPGLAPDWHSGPGIDWSHTAPAETLQAAHLPEGTAACWHPRAAWVRPARLVAALLAQPGIIWQGNANVARLARTEGDQGTLWQVFDEHGTLLASAPFVVVAAGPASRHLTGERLPLQSVRGQLSWGLQDAEITGVLPPFPVNGDGSLVAHIPQENGPLAWHLGSTFERDKDQLPPSATDQAAGYAANRQRLTTLLPHAVAALEGAFDARHPTTAVRDWANVRCVAPDRMPMVGPLDNATLPGLWVCTALGARGLALGLLCGELLAARLQGEPLPVDARLAGALAIERL